MSSLKLVHFSDILCVWAFIGQTPVYRLAERFGHKVDIDVHYCSVFPDAQAKVDKLWGNRGGFAAYANHVQEVVDGFDGVTVHDDVWSKTRPLSSASPHLFLKAVQLLSGGEDAPDFTARSYVKAAKELRSAFFERGQNISDWSVQQEVSETVGLDFSDVCKKIETGEAMAKLASDYELAQSSGVKGSPTYILNNGRQILFGNISYSVLEANVVEVLKERDQMNASPC